MEGINKIFCGSDTKNTGICECFFDPKLITGAILVPLSRVFTEDELADANIQATLEAAVLASPANRIQPFGPFEAITDNTEDPTRQTFGYGTVKTVREGRYNWQFQYLNGGLNLSNALRTYNGLIGKYGVVFTESNNTLIGTSRKDANGDWGLAPVRLSDIYARPWRPSDGTNVTNYTWEVSFDPVYINEKIAFKKVSFDSYLLAELVALEDVKLSWIDEGTEGGTVVTVGAETDCGSTNFFDLFDDELAQVGAWIVKSSAGEAKTITSAVKDDDTKGWVITLGGGDTWQDGDTVELAEPAVLAANPINVSGYDSDVLTADFGS